MKISTRYMKRISGLVALLFLLAPLTVRAQTKVVVIPLFGDDPKPLKNIITVAKANGDFTDPVAAVNSIADASADNPYLVVIGPGVYTITRTLVMKEYVDITGSGENVTRLTGAISTGSNDKSSTIISGTSYSGLSSLTVENTGGNSYSIALYNGNASPMVTHVTATASGGTQNWGVYNYYSSPTMTSVTATSSGGASGCGVRNYSSSPTMTSVIATSSGGTDGNMGILNTLSSPTMTNVTATGSGGSGYNYGIYNDSSCPTITGLTTTASEGNFSCGAYNANSSPTMTGVFAAGSGATLQNIGIYNSSCSSPVVIRRSTLKGDPSLYNYDSTAAVSQSTLLTGVSGGGTFTNQCVACDDGSGNALTSSCGSLPPPPS